MLANAVVRECKAAPLASRLLVSELQLLCCKSQSDIRYSRLTGAIPANTFAYKVWLDARDRLAANFATLGIVGFLLIPRLPYPVLHNGLLVPLYCLLVVGLARGGGLVGAVLRHPVLVRLGESSYALYILQFPLWHLTAIALEPAGYKR